MAIKCTVIYTKHIMVNYAYIFFLIGFMAKTLSPSTNIGLATHKQWIRVTGINEAGPNGTKKLLHHISMGSKRQFFLKCSSNHWTLAIITFLSSAPIQIF